MKKYKPMIYAILSGLFGYLVAIVTKNSYMGILIIVATFLILHLLKKFIFKK